MGEFITPSPEYVEGFNNGYLLAQHKPELAASIDKLEKRDERLQGFGDGRRAYFLEIGKDKMPFAQSKGVNNENKSKNLDKDDR
jgi:hypothetical protein